MTRKLEIPESRDLPDWSHIGGGKVRELYVHRQYKNILLMFASNRVSAFDFVLEPEIPEKGRMLTQMSNWWFRKLPAENHLLENYDQELYRDLASHIPSHILERSTICRKMDIIPFEFVIRGYLTGSAWADYLENNTVYGIKLKGKFRQGDRLPGPIFTPTTKSRTKDTPVRYEDLVNAIGLSHAQQLREMCTDYYTTAEQIARNKGLIIADAKFEFGIAEGKVYIADELLTADSARYWDINSWGQFDLPIERRLDSFDKQAVRDWVKCNSGKNITPQNITPLRLPQELIQTVYKKYKTLLAKLTG